LGYCNVAKKKKCERDCLQGHVIIIGGANDTARNVKEISNKTLAILICMNVLVFNIPTRHDLIKESARKSGKQMWT
jgi:hypothetical protein